MKIFRGILAIVVAIVVGSVAMTSLHSLGMVFWPEDSYPAGASPEELQAWMDGLRMETKLFATFAHWAGTGIAAGLAVMIAAPVADAFGELERPMWPAWALGGWFLVGGTANAYMLGTPLWLSAVDVAGYLPVAWLIGRALRYWQLSAPADFA
jgi:hypothetical protein